MREVNSGLLLLSCARPLPRAAAVACTAQTKERTENCAELSCSSSDVETTGSSDENSVSVQLLKNKTLPSAGAAATTPDDHLPHAAAPATVSDISVRMASSAAELCGVTTVAGDDARISINSAAGAAGAGGRGRRREAIAHSAVVPSGAAREIGECPSPGVAAQAKLQTGVYSGGPPAAASPSPARRNREETKFFSPASVVAGEGETGFLMSRGRTPVRKFSPDLPPDAAPAAPVEPARRRSMQIAAAVLPPAVSKTDKETMYAAAVGGGREKSRTSYAAVPAGGGAAAYKTKKKVASLELFKGTFYGSEALNPKFVATQLAVLLSAFYLFYALLCFAAFGVYLIGEGGSAPDKFSPATGSPAAAAQTLNEAGPLTNAIQEQALASAAPTSLRPSLRGNKVPFYLPKATASARESSAGERRSGRRRAGPSAGDANVWTDTLATSSLSRGAAAAAAEEVEDDEQEEEKGRRTATKGKPPDGAAALLLDRQEGRRRGRRREMEATVGDRPEEEAVGGAEEAAAAELLRESGGGEGGAAAEQTQTKKPSGRKAILIFDAQVYEWSTVNGRILLIIFFTSSVAMSYIVFLVVQRTRKCLDFCFSIQLLHLIACWLLRGFPLSLNWWVCSLASGITNTLLSQYLCRKVEMEDIVFRWHGGASYATTHQDRGSPVQRAVEIETIPVVRKQAHVDTSAEHFTCRGLVPVLIGRSTEGGPDAYACPEGP